MTGIMLETPEIVTTEPVPAAVIRLTIPRARMRLEFGPAVHEILEAVAAQGIGPAGPPFAYHSISGELAETGRVLRGELPGARVARTTYRGDYEGLPDAWREFGAWIQAAGPRTGDAFWERYVVGPESGDDVSKYQTELAWTLESEE